MHRKWLKNSLGEPLITEAWSKGRVSGVNEAPAVSDTIEEFKLNIPEAPKMAHQDDLFVCQCLCLSNSKNF
jgi:hypothetical protein